MGGSQSFFLPTNPDEQASLFYRFLFDILSGKFNFIIFTLHVYGYRRFDDNVHEFNDDITRKLSRTLNYKLNEIESDAKNIIFLRY